MPHHNVFTVRAFDYLNYNPSSTTAKDSFHETGISLFQFPTELNGGISQGALQLKKRTGLTYLIIILLYLQ